MDRELFVDQSWKDYSFTFRSRLQKLIVKKGISQNRIAGMIGIDSSSISRLRSGKSQLPHGKILIGLCAVLGCSADYLLGLRDEV